MHFEQRNRIAALLDASTQGREHVGEQQANQLLSIRCRPILPDLCHERIGGGEHDAGIVHSLTGELFGKIAGRARSIQHGLHGKAFERSIDCRKDKTCLLYTSDAADE